MKKLGGYISSLLLIAGFILIMGTAGASDNDAIGFTSLVIQGSIGILLIVSGYFLSEKIGGCTYLG